MHDEEPTGGDDGPTAWVVLDGVDAPGSASVFWRESEARAHAAAVAARDRDVLLQRVTIRGDRWRCRLCGEPVELDDPADPLSWIHAPDANDLGDHTAEI